MVEVLAVYEYDGPHKNTRPGTRPRPQSSGRGRTWAHDSSHGRVSSIPFDGAKSCWVDDRVGTLEPGKRADVLVVEGDPSQDIKALGDTVDVFQGGSRVDRANLV